MHQPSSPIRVAALARLLAAALLAALTGCASLPSGLAGLPSAALAPVADATLDVQYYHVENDATGRHFLRAMRDAALRCAACACACCWTTCTRPATTACC